MCKRPKRRPYILIEVLVATSLFIMLLIAIFGIFWRTSKTNVSLNRLRIANEQMIVAQAKLQNVFSNVVFKKSYSPYFYIDIDKNSGLTSLIFTVDNPVQTIPALSGITLQKLYVEDNQLVLATFPHEETGIPEIMEKEALLSNITDFQIEVFLAPTAQDQEAESEEPKKKPTEGAWTDVWLREYNSAPTLIKLQITKGTSGSFTLWFFMPLMTNTVLYDKG